VWRTDGSLVETVDEDPQRLILFLPNAEERKCCGLMWTVAGEVSSEHMGEGVKAFNGVWR